MFGNSLLTNGLLEKMLDNYNLPTWSSTITTSSPILKDDDTDIDYKKKQINIAVPGFTMKEISIKIEDKLLTVSADVPAEETTRLKSSFKKIFTLGDKIDVNSFKATYKAGILTISYELTEEKNAINIKITEE